MLALPPSVSINKDNRDITSPKDEKNKEPLAPPGDSGPLNPPIITHTAATPAATPQGSPNETLSNNKNSNTLAVANRPFNMSAISIDSIDRSSVSF